MDNTIKNPFFSVIVPSFNRAHMLPKAIESVLSQTFSDWELIIIDDGSTDNTKEVVEAYKDNRIVYIYQENAERSAARNKGIAISRGKYICFLDSDDYYLENRLALLHERLTNSGDPVIFSFTGLRFTDGVELVYEEPLGNVFDYLMTHVIGVPQVCISIEILRKYSFNINFRVGEDLELWLRIAQEHQPVYFREQCTVIATQHDDRTVNERVNNSGMEQLKVIKHIIADSAIKKKLTQQVICTRLSNTYFSIARHFMYKGKIISAGRFLFLSLISKIFHPQTKHKFYIFANLITGKIPEQYR